MTPNETPRRRLPTPSTALARRRARALRGSGRVAAPALAVALACSGGGSDAGPAPAAEGPPPVRAEAGVAFDLPYGRVAEVDGGPTVAFRRLAEESRCPESARCVTAGNAAAEFAVETDAGAEATLVLNTGRRPMDAPAHGWRVRLEGLAPHPPAPGSPVDTAAYVATVVVEPAE